jgi:hypothetical protein
MLGCAYDYTFGSILEVRIISRSRPHVYMNVRLMRALVYGLHKKAVIRATEKPRELKGDWCSIGDGKLIPRLILLYLFKQA